MNGRLQDKVAGHGRALRPSRYAGGSGQRLCVLGLGRSELRDGRAVWLVDGGITPAKGAVGDGEGRCHHAAADHAWTAPLA
jgi:hypothetical protein